MGTRLREPETLASFVNAVVVLCLPSVVAGIAMFQALNNPGYTWGGHPAGWSPWPDVIAFLVGVAVVMSPFALLAAWRTWVHARRWRSGSPGRSLQGVVEAGACGLGVAVLMLLRPSIMRPSQAPPYLIFYGGLGLVIGLALGFVLFLTAAVVLILTRRFAK